MKSVAWVLAIAMVVSTSAEARHTPRHDWAPVQSLKQGSTVRVFMRNGERLEGYLQATSNDSLKLDVTEPGSGIVLTFGRTLARVDVVRLYKAHLTVDRPRRLSGKELLIGTAVGVAVGVGVGAIYDANHPYGDDPGAGKLTFGILGALLGPAVAAVSRGVANLGHRPVLIYEAPAHP